MSLDGWSRERDEETGNWGAGTGPGPTLSPSSGYPKTVVKTLFRTWYVTHRPGTLRGRRDRSGTVKGSFCPGTFPNPRSAPTTPPSKPFYCKIPFPRGSPSPQIRPKSPLPFHPARTPIWSFRSFPLALSSEILSSEGRR